MDPTNSSPSSSLSSSAFNSRTRPQIAPILFPTTSGATARTPSKKRSLSDSTPVLGPSPKLNETPQLARHGNSIITTPSRGPRRSIDLAARGLILQMPPRDISALLNTASCRGQSPSVDLEAREPYGSPSSVLPRHSRGLDFSRAATNLHHSTLAEQPSPESSPTVIQRGFMPASRRSSMYSMADSPRLTSSSVWSGGSVPDRGFFARSVGSTYALTSEASDSSSEDDDVSMLQDDPEDAIVSTPQMRRPDAISHVTPFAVPSRSIELHPCMQSLSPGANAFVNYRRGILNRRPLRQGRGSVSNRSRTASPDTHAGSAEIRHTSHSTQDVSVRRPPSRRDSLSLGIGNGLHITSSNESGDDAFNIPPMTHGVVRRPVTRRSNMLPKTKNFARIRAALQEESAPVDSEAKRESEVVKQVRVNEVGRRDQLGAMPASPDLMPTIASYSHDSSEMSDIDGLSTKSGLEGPKNLPDFRRDSIQKEFWPRLNNGMQTPPPNFARYRSSSGVSEDVTMDSPKCATPPSSLYSATSAILQEAKPDLETGTPAYFQPPNLPSAAEISLKAKNKRRRDDDFDINSFKRRAVSPGLSNHSSPILGQSPASASGVWSKQPKSSTSEKSSSGSATEERTGSIGSAGYVTPTLGPKRVGLQGMVDTNDSLMSMSIE